MTSSVICGKCVNIPERTLIHAGGVSDAKMIVLRMEEEDTCRKDCDESPPCRRRAEVMEILGKGICPLPSPPRLTGRFAGLSVVTHVSVSSWSRRFKTQFWVLLGEMGRKCPGAAEAAALG